MAEMHLFSRVVQCGDTVEVYQYSSAIKVGHERAYDIVRRDGSVIDDELVKRSDSLYRSRQTLRRLIWANQGKYTKFVTLTYRETVLDVKQVRRDITTFVQKMRRKGYTMNYVYVLENQKDRGEKEGNDGCLHVHMLIFNDEFLSLDLLNSCWKHGSTDISALEHVTNVGAYVCKYITKEGTRAFGSQVYGCSNGLKRPAEERFFTEGLSDTTIGLHPKEVLDGLDIKYKSQMRHDYIDEQGVGREQIVNYYQGTWKVANVIEQHQEKD